MWSSNFNHTLAKQLNQVRGIVEYYQISHICMNTCNLRSNGLRIYPFYAWRLMIYFPVLLTSCRNLVNNNNSFELPSIAFGEVVVQFLPQNRLSCSSMKLASLKGQIMFALGLTWACFVPRDMLSLTGSSSTHIKILSKISFEGHNQNLR